MNRYLFAPESTKKLRTLQDDLSKSFTHYYKLLNSDKSISFKYLRKTYITLLNNHTNGRAEVITGHSGQEIIMKNYHDSKVFNDVVLNFKMIS